MKVVGGSEETSSVGLQVTTARGYAKVEYVTTAKLKKAEKNLLHPMSLDFPEGTVTAILGPSGAGKTSLLSFITNNISSNLEARGEISLPGTDAFVPQDDRLHGFYTCEAYLKHYARLTGLPMNAKTNEKIDELLESLGLTEHRNTIVGDGVFFKGLSGGQQRRLSIGLEALSNPKNFYLDEPTSGLDSESALQVMYYLKKYVRDSPGRRVIITMHQPSSFIWKLIDNVVLLAKGRLVYQGSREHIESFFTYAGCPTPAEYNPADHYVTAVNDDFGNNHMTAVEWESKYLQFHKEEMVAEQRISAVLRTRKSWLAISDKDHIETQRHRDPLHVAVELTRRYWLNLLFNPGILYTRIAMYVALAFMVGILFWNLGDDDTFSSIQSRSAILFYCVSFFIFMSVAVFPFTVQERAIVDKEVRNSYYHPAAYQLAQSIASIPGQAVLALLVTVIIVTMLKLRDPFWYFLAMFLSLVTAEALAQLVSHVVPHFIIGMALVAGMYGFFMLILGFMIIPSDFPNWLAWTYYIAFHTYAWRTFMYSEFCCEDEIYGSTEVNPQFTSGQDVLEFYEIDNVNRGNDMIVLVGYALCLHVFSCIVLHFKYTAFRGEIQPLTTDPSNVNEANDCSISSNNNSNNSNNSNNNNIDNKLDDQQQRQTIMTEQSSSKRQSGGLQQLQTTTDQSSEESEEMHC